MIVLKHISIIENLEYFEVLVNTYYNLYKLICYVG